MFGSDAMEPTGEGNSQWAFEFSPASRDLFTYSSTVVGSFSTSYSASIIVSKSARSSLYCNYLPLDRWKEGAEHLDRTAQNLSYSVRLLRVTSSRLLTSTSTSRLD